MHLHNDAIQRDKHWTRTPCTLSQGPVERNKYLGEGVNLDHGGILVDERVVQVQ